MSQAGIIFVDAFVGLDLRPQTDLTLTNAKIVTPTAIVSGTLTIEDGLIVGMNVGASKSAEVVDCQGDYVLPGLVELHTDNFERCYAPRPGATWPRLPALLTHDAHLATAGVTTVVNAVSLGSVWLWPERPDFAGQAIAAIDEAREEDALRVDHFLHLRVETSAEDALPPLDAWIDRDDVRLISVMDHTPGQRQFRNFRRLEGFLAAEYGLKSDELDAWADDMQKAAAITSPAGRAHAAKAAKARNLPLATHDDESAAHIDEALTLGAAVSEFPTTMEAASAAQANGMTVICGAPNVVRGGSLSGNVSARDLIAEDLVDALSSDYAPTSLLQAIFALADGDEARLPRMTALASKGPADMIGLTDRGRIEAGTCADVIRVTPSASGLPILRDVWRRGARVA